MHSLRKLKSATFAFTGFAAALSLPAQTVNSPGTDTPAADPDKPEVLQRFVVTGSNIASATSAVATPLSVVGPQDIEDAGVQTNALDILRKVSPSISGVGTENATSGSSSTLGGSEAVIHGLPTLVLINSRRVAYDPADASNATSEFVDLNMIPVAAIGRIEVLTGGASAIYGSDAVGGVINIILKKDYNGWNLSTHYGFSDNNGHYSERVGSLVGGTSNGKTSVTLSAEYSQTDPIYFKNRPYTNPYYATTYYPGIIDVYNVSSGNDEYYQLAAGKNAPPGGGAYTINQLVQMGDYIDLGNSNSAATVAGIQKGLNLADNQALAESNKRQSVTLDFEHHLFNDSLVAFGDVIYSHTGTQSALNAQPLFPYISTPNIDLVEYGVSPPPATAEYTPASASVNPFSEAYLDQGAADGSAGNAITVHNRFVAYPRIFQNDSTLFRIEGGLRGRINEDYSWETGVDLNRYQLAYANLNLLDQNALIAAFASGGINPFALAQAPGVLPGAVLGTAFVNYVSTLNSYDALLRGAPFELPAGKLNFAVGASLTRENLTAVPDANTADGGWVDSPTVLPFNRNRQIVAAYGEVEVPVLAHSPYAYSLQIDAAVRYENYQNIGSSTVPKADLKYQPFDEQLTLRASAGKSFIAPTLYALYGPVIMGSSNPITYTGANGTTYQSVQFQAVGGSNPDLQPSKSTTWSAGFVYSPKRVTALTFTADYYQTVEKGEVGFVDQGTVVQSVEDLGAASPYVADLHFGGANGPEATGDAPGQVSGKPLSTVYLVTPYVNLGSTAIKGIDASVEYALQTAFAGTFKVSAAATLYSSYLLQILPTENYYQYAGTASGNAFANAVGTLPRWRTYTTFEWKRHRLDAFVAQTFVPTVEAIGPGGTEATAAVRIPSYQQYDLGIGYKFSALKLTRWLDGLYLRVGVNNLFDYMPPSAPGAIFSTNSDVATYNGSVGRMFYFDAGYKF